MKDHDRKLVECLWRSQAARGDSGAREALRLCGIPRGGPCPFGKGLFPSCDCAPKLGSPPPANR